MRTKKLLSFAMSAAFLVVVIVSCDTTRTNTEPGEGSVELQFGTVTSPVSSKAASSGNAAATNNFFIVEGTNGALQIDDFGFIIKKIKLESDIEKRETGPFFVNLPLNEDALSLAINEIEPALYEEFEFEINPVDFEEEEIEDTIRPYFPDWPDQASMVLTGTFFPNNGDDPRPFKVFAKGEIEVEWKFEPPLEVTEDHLEQVVSITIDPAHLLEKLEGFGLDGEIVDLSRYDWDQNQKLLEFSAKFKEGFVEIRVEDQDFDDD